MARAALGAPGRLTIEVGLSGPRHTRPQGRRTEQREIALRRALGGVSYPADRSQLLAQAGAWLRQRAELVAVLEGLPEEVFGTEQEVLARLVSAGLWGGSQSTGSAGSGKDIGSRAQR